VIADALCAKLSNGMANPKISKTADVSPHSLAFRRQQRIEANRKKQESW
jgi:hypothetical protein